MVLPVSRDAGLPGVYPEVVEIRHRIGIGTQADSPGPEKVLSQPCRRRR